MPDIPHYRIVHGVRIGLAFVITFLLLRLLRVPEGIWPLSTLVDMMRYAEQREAAGEWRETAAELRALMQEASAERPCEASICGYIWLSMELAQQLEELSDLLKVCTARVRE